MKRRNLLVRVFRAVSGESQKSYAKKTGVHSVLLAHYELGKTEPSQQNLERLAQGVDLTVAEGEQILDLADTLRKARQRAGSGEPRWVERLAALFSQVYQRLLRLPQPSAAPKPEDRIRAGQLWDVLQNLAEEQQLNLVRRARSFQSWAVCEKLCADSEEAASKDIGRAARLASLAREIASHVRGPKGWPDRIQGYAEIHVANIHRVAGDHCTAVVSCETAKRLWKAGADPARLLDPGRILDLEASLDRDQRRFEEALARLDEAFPVSRSPGRVLIKKGFTLEVMGEHRRAIETLRQAEPLVELQGDERLLYMCRFNLAVSYSHLGKFRDAAQLAAHVRDLAARRGDANELPRVTWLEGRISAGLGRRDEALKLLDSARKQLAERKMWYDVALALLEMAVLLLERGDTATVKGLAEELRQAFEANGVHREALAALRLFHQAAERETATAELARRVLGYLFRARHDQELRFEDPAVALRAE